MQIYAIDKNERPIFFEVLESEENRTVYGLKADFPTEKEELAVCFPELDAQSGEEGFYLLPGNRSTPASPLISFRQKEDDTVSLGETYLSLFAAKVRGKTFVVLIDRTYRFKVTASCQNGSYSIGLLFCTAEPRKDPLRLTVLELPGCADESAIANAVREFRLKTGRIRPLSEKCRKRKELDYIRRYPLIRIRMAWKPVPPTVLHQTVENEPDLHVACTFRRVREIIREMKRQKIEGAEISLVGWNRMGHDGRWPQIFPVEPALGGETELRKTIECAKQAGYMITCHNNFLDHYEIADCFSESELARTRDGSSVQIGKWGGGAAYRACPICQKRHAAADYPKIADLGFSGNVYTDVLSITDPDICFDSRHPCNTPDAIDCMRSIMKTAAKEFGGFSSEGCMDFCDGELDFSLYNTFKDPQERPIRMADRYIPLTELIYHGIFLYNPSSVTVNHAIKEPNAGVFAALLGGRPTFYYYSRFCTGAVNWMGETDLTCDNQEELEASVRVIRETCDRFRPIAEKQTVFWHSYSASEEGLLWVTYQDGTVVAANPTDSPLLCQNTRIPAHSWQIFKKD